MIDIKVRTNFKAVYKEMAKVQKQARFATAVALTRTAKDVQKVVVKQMKIDLDNPTPFTLKGTYVKTANKKDPIMDASVGLKDHIPKGTAAAKYLNPQIYGGERNIKRSERHLKSTGKMPSTLYLVPGQALKLNKYGNVTKGTMTKIISQVKGFDEVGFTANKKGTSALFVLKKENGKLKPGIWARKGGKVKPMLMYVKKPHYKKKYKFFEVGNKTRDKVFKSHWNREFINAMKTAK